MNKLKYILIFVLSITLLLLFTSCKNKDVKELEQANTTIGNNEKLDEAASNNKNQDENEKTVNISQTENIFINGDANVIASENKEKPSENRDYNSLIDNENSSNEQTESNTKM